MTGKGGYQIIDFKGVTLSNQGVVIPGIFLSVENLSGKCLMATNVTLADRPGTLFANSAYWVNCSNNANERDLTCPVAIGSNQIQYIMIRVRNTDLVTAGLINPTSSTSANTIDSLHTEEVK